ncbi:hypothetical protein [Stutzerimonas nitrititolerans]|uniref:hypothetical protein n=1 Tax=Stutzerimonas nitrititolerans TaxID=2482751 RepID=UPI00289B0F71|nr:hypothetical protein [Stutzerimonas nitrititolerans]
MSDIGGAIRSIDELVEEVTRLHVLLRGSEAYPGILEQASDLAGKLASVRDQLGSAARLSEQLDALPERLLRSADDQQFKAALRESIAQVLADAIVDARRHVQDEAAQVAIDELSAKVKVAMSQLGESSANFLAERNKLRGLLESEQIKSTELAKRLEYFEQDKDNALRLLSVEFAQVSKRSGRARLVDFGLGVAITLLVSLSTLYPAAAQYLKTPSQHHQQR